MSCKLTELLSYRKIWAGKSLWRSSCLIPHSKHMQLQQVVQGCVWMSFEYLQKWRCQYLYQYFAVLIVKRCFLKSDWNSFCSLRLLPLIQFLYTSEKFAFSVSHHNVLVVNNEITPTFLFFRLNKPNSISSSSYIHVLLDICSLRWLEHNLNSWIRCLNTSRRSLC